MLNKLELFQKYGLVVKQSTFHTKLGYLNTPFCAIRAIKGLNWVGIR